MKVMPRERLAIQETAIPTIFPNCPSYLTDRAEKPKRLSKERKEEEMLQDALVMSRLDDNVTVVKFSVSTFDELLFKLHFLDLKSGWFIHNTGASSLILFKIVVSGDMASIERTLNIDHNLQPQAFYSEKHPIPLSVPKITDIRQIETVVNEINLFSLPLPKIQHLSI